MNVSDTERRTELETLKKFGMRWAVLLSVSYDPQQRKADQPAYVAEELRLARIMLESGCFSTCEVNCILDKTERELLQKATLVGDEYFGRLMELLKKAMLNELTPKDVKGLPFIKPIISDCEFLRCICEQNDRSKELSS